MTGRRHRPIDPLPRSAVTPELSRWRPGPGRLARLFAGLTLFGVGEALIVASGLGNSPWTVLAQGLSRQVAIGIGAATVLVSAAVLCAWVPLRQRPGLGTLANAVWIGLAIAATLAAMPSHAALAARIALIPAGIALVGLGSGLYLTSRLGPGPRDGLMTGLHRRTGASLRAVRSAIEASACLAGFALGGTLGIGTVAFALLIGPAVQVAVHALGGAETRGL